MGGPVFGLKAGIDAGRYTRPCIWPSEAVISQTSGCGDFRLPAKHSRRFFGKPCWRIVMTGISTSGIAKPVQRAIMSDRRPASHITPATTQ
jgi:hypothetical protein